MVICGPNGMFEEVRPVQRRAVPCPVSRNVVGERGELGQVRVQPRAGRTRPGAGSPADEQRGAQRDHAGADQRHLQPLLGQWPAQPDRAPEHPDAAHQHDGTSAAAITSRSATSTQVSIAPRSPGAGTSAAARGPAPGMISSRGTPVPTWSGTRSRVKAELPSCGASMMPDAISTRTHALAPGRSALGHQAGQQDQQRVGERGRGVHQRRAHPPDQLHDHVLGQLGGVERDVGHGPAVQQQVAVQHVPRLQGVGPAVRRDGLGSGDPQVTQEQHDARRPGTRRSRSAGPSG